MKRRICKSINVYIIFIHFLIKKKLYHEYSTKQQNYPLRDTIYHSNSHENLWTAESFDVPKKKNPQSSVSIQDQHVIYSPSQYPKTFALHPLWSPFPILRKKRWSTSLRFHHPSVNRTMNRGKLYPLRPSNQPTNRSIHKIRKNIARNREADRSKPNEKQSVSPSVIRFLQRIRNPRMNGPSPSCPVMNRILIAAKRSRIAVIRFGLLSIYNEHVVSRSGFPVESSSDCTDHCTPEK